MINKNLINYVLHLADNPLILAQRNSEWCGHGPVLEQDIAITNISLDLIGQARSFYQYAAHLINQSTNQPITQSTEDTLAYHRDTRDFKNSLLVEQANGDWGKTILRQFFFSNYQYLLYKELQQSADETLAAIAEKGIKEVTYHLRWSSEWVIRLGDGTEESHNRMLNAIEELWPYVNEMFIASEYESELSGDKISVEVSLIKSAWQQKTESIFVEGTLPVPQPAFAQTGGKQGLHSEQLGYILAEMQYLQRAYPNNTW